MKTNFRIQAWLFSAAILGTSMLYGTPASAAIVQTVNQTGAAATGWSAAIWGSPAAVATSGNDYETTNTFAVRTPNVAAPAAFPGKSLTIDSGGILYLKHTGGAAGVNLIMNGGTITYHGGPTTANSPLSGTIQVVADSVINSDQSGANARDVLLLSSLSGTGNLSVTLATNAVILSGDDSAYSGNWTLNTGNLIIGNGATNAPGSGGVTLNTAASSLIFNATNDFVVTNLLTGPGTVQKLNTNTVTLNGNNDPSFYGTVQVRAGVLKLQSATAISAAPTITLAGGTVNASPIGGLVLSASPVSQVLNCRGTIISNLTASSDNTLNFNLSPTTNDILNVTGSLTLNGNPTLNLALSGYKPSGSYRLINYTGTIQGGGSFNVVPPSGSAETFVLDTSTPGQVNLVITGISQNLTWVGDGGGNNWDTTSPNWTGDATTYADGDSVTFNDSGSATPDINLIVAVFPSSMTVNNTTEPYIFDGLGISTSGALNKLGVNDLTFTSPNNNFTGPVNIQAGTLSIGAGGGTGSLGNPSSITNNGVLQVNMSSAGVSIAAPISGSGSLVVTGGGNTTVLRGTNSYTGLTTIGDGCQLNITSSSALGTTDAGTVVLANGRLGVASLVGTVTVPEPITVNGTGISAAPGAIYVNTVGNNITWSGPVIVASDSRFRAVNNGVQMNFSNTVLGTNVALECSAGSAVSDTTTAITFQNTLSLGNSGALTVDGFGLVILAGNTNLWGSTTINGGALLVNGHLDGGTVTVNSTGIVGGSGIILGPVSVQDGGVLAPGNNGIGTLTLSNSLTLSGLAATVMEINRTNLQNADLLVASAMACDGTLTVTNIGDALQAGDTFHLFAASLSGAFAVTNLPEFASTNLYWDVSQFQSLGNLKVASTALPPPNTPTITSPGFSGTNFTMQVNSSQVGYNYVLQATPSLAPATWTNIQTNAGTGGTLNFSLPITTGNPQQYFRISAQ